MNIKNLNASFAILCAEHDLRSFSNTVNSINNYCSNVPCIGVVVRDTPIGLIEQMKEICPVYRGKNTHTSLMNTALRNCPTEWCIFVISGTWVRRNLAYKYSRFVDDDTDILYPIVLNNNNWVYSFRNSTLNGICINKKTFKKVGAFQDEGKLKIAKEQWFYQAIEKCDSKFKAILGANIE
jgi:hypothetical protein